MESEARNRVLAINRRNWNAQANQGNEWTVPVDTAAVAKAKKGLVEIVLTPQKLVPQHWFPELSGCKTLMLASGGGQQSPLLAAAGAEVTVVDLSDQQLERDRLVAQRDDLGLLTVRGSMDDLSMLPDAYFDLVVHPCSNSFVPDLQPVWKEVARVTKPGAFLMVGFCSPVLFLFDEQEAEEGHDLMVRYSLPYSDETCLSKERLHQLQEQSEPLMFGHNLTDQLGGQLKAGFELVDMFEDTWKDNSNAEPTGIARLDKFIPSFLATLARRSQA